MKNLFSIALMTLAFATNTFAAANKPTDAFELQVSRIANAFEGYSTYKVFSDKPEDMLKEYTQVKYADQSEDYSFNFKATGMNEDANEAGLFSQGVAYGEVMTQLLDEDKLNEAQQNGKEALDYVKRVQDVRNALETANRYGAIYGYDAGEQNGCASPTPYLLILNPKTKTVYGINLYPCQE